MFQGNIKMNRFINHRIGNLLFSLICHIETWGEVLYTYYMTRLVPQDSSPEICYVRRSTHAHDWGVLRILQFFPSSRINLVSFSISFHRFLKSVVHIVI